MIEDMTISIAPSSIGGSTKKKGGVFHKLAKTFFKGENAQSRKERRKGEAIFNAKAVLVEELSKAEGDVESSAFKKALDDLTALYDPTKFDSRVRTSKKDLAVHLGGTWATLSKPTFKGCIGKTESGDPVYTLGVSFPS